jgi:AraC-like DNA-binding protein
MLKECIMIEGVFSSMSRIISICLFCLFIPSPHLCQPQQDDNLTPERLIQNIQTHSFSGKKIDFIFSNAGVDEMIDHLESISGFRFDLDPEIKATGTYHMQQVPWDQALAAILTDNELNIDLGSDSIKIYKGKKYVLAFKDQKKAKILIFLYKYFNVILISISFLTAVLIGLILIKKIKTKRNRILRKNLLDQELAEETEKRLYYLLEIEKIYRDEKLSLISLSDRLKITPHQLSWVINQKINKSFPSLVNFYRVEEVKKELSQSNQNETTILQIAFEAGFSTKTSFNRTFKKITGLTPSQYRDRLLRRDGLSSHPE